MVCNCGYTVTGEREIQRYITLYEFVIQTHHAGCVTIITSSITNFDHYTDPEFCKGLELRPEPNADRIKDIYDGSEYTKLCGPGGFLCKHLNPANLSFTINTDGVALFKSSSTNIWPIFLAINELPPHLRYTLRIWVHIICIRVIFAISYRFVDIPKSISFLLDFGMLNRSLSC